MGKFFKLDDTYTVEAEFKKTRMAFKHTAVITENGRQVFETKICYQNRTWESYEYQDVVHKAIRGWFKGKNELIDACIKTADAIGKGIEEHRFDSLKMVCAIGDLLCNTPQEKAKWKKRMISTVPGIDIPADFDQLPVEEQQSRLAKAVEVL